MRIVAVSYYDEIFVPIVRDICARAGWTVCDWLVAYESRDPAVRPETAFPGAIIHRPAIAARGMLPPEMRAAGTVELDKDILSKMAPYESMFMRMLDIFDPDGHSFSGRERRAVYYDFLRAALQIVRAHQPGLFIAGTIPHSLHDYMLYAVCKAHGIDTLVYVAFTIPGYLLLNSSLDEGNPRLGAAYHARLAQFAGEDIPLPADLDAYLSQIQRHYTEGEPWYSKIRDHTMLAQSGGRLGLADPRAYWRKVRRLAGFAYHFLRAPRRRYEEHFVRPMTDFFKRRGVSLRHAKDTQFSANRVFAAGERSKRKLLDQYRALQRLPDLAANFVFVPLHYQPEASTSPMGGAFLDQILMIRLLANCLPKDWKIYVKEHRTTFDPDLRGHFARDLQYYPEILEVPGTVLVPMELTPFELIDRARAVASVAGTAGWEAVARGVPALIFGNAWYKDCEGVFDARTHEDCAKAVATIAEGFRPDRKRVRLFLQTLAEVALRADRDNTFILTELTPEQSRKATVEHFLREYPLMAARGG